MHHRVVRVGAVDGGQNRQRHRARPSAERSVQATSNRLPRCNVRTRHRPSPVLPLRRVEVPRGGVAVPEGNPRRAVAAVDESNAARPDDQDGPEKEPALHQRRRRLRASVTRRLRRVVHHRGGGFDVLPHLQPEELRRDQLGALLAADLPGALRYQAFVRAVQGRAATERAERRSTLAAIKPTDGGIARVEF